MLSIIKKSRWLLLVLMSLFSNQAFAHGMSEAEKQIMIDGGNLQYMWVGARHMLSGYDHLAFIFGIIFVLSRFKEVVKYMTLFTLGHCITLIFATFNAWSVNYFLIDAIIALSVCYKAFHNLGGFEKYLGTKSPNLLFMVFSFGLIHGLGLSTRLQQLPLSEDDLLMNIISFNVGVEVGQISALVVMMLLIVTFRKSHFFEIFSKIANSLLMIFGIFLFLMQMHGYEHSAYAEDYVINQQPIPLENNQQIMLPQMSQSSDWTDVITVIIPARGDKEYKLQLAKGATFEYKWQTDKGALFFDFHGEPKGDTTGYFKSFKKQTSSQSSGFLTTIFAGTHGWYWKNNHSFPISIILKVKGEYKRLDLKVNNRPIKLKQPLKKITHDSL
jgi:hypothetical protein